MNKKLSMNLCKYRSLFSVMSTLNQYDLEEMISKAKALEKQNKELKAAMQEFVDRCEKGEVRSKYTYKKFKELLNREE